MSDSKITVLTNLSNPDERIELDLLRLKAATGDAKAMCMLGELLLRGENIEQNEVEGAALMLRSAEMGHVDAIAEAGLIHELGLGKVPVNFKKARDLYRASADAGDPVGMIRLANLYRHGLGGVKACQATSYTWNRRAADLGSKDGMYCVAGCFIMGRGVGKNEATGLDWLERAAKAGHVDALCEVGEGHLQGRGVAMDAAKAVDYYRHAAKAGSAAGMCWLANCLDEGLGAPKNTPMAILYWRKASDMGNGMAAFKLGTKFENGLDGFKKDSELAMQFFPPLR